MATNLSAERIIAGPQEDQAVELAFSTQAAKSLNDAVEQYRQLLVGASARLATREQLDSISDRHVRSASRALVCPHFRRGSSVLATLGGVFLGIAASLLVQLIRGPLTNVEIIAALLSIGLGGAMVGALWTDERNTR